MTTLTYPESTLETKWGVLCVTFLDPDTTIPGEYELDHTTQTRVPKRVERCAAVLGELTINGVAVRVSDSYRLAKCSHRDGEELPEPVTEFRPVYGYGYNRRANHSGADLPKGVKRILWRDLPEVVREFYESHPDLQRAAKRVEILRRINDAENEMRQAEQALLEAGKRRADAAQELAEFDAA